MKLLGMDMQQVTDGLAQGLGGILAGGLGRTTPSGLAAVDFTGSARGRSAGGPFAVPGVGERPGRGMAAPDGGLGAWGPLNSVDQWQRMEFSQYGAGFSSWLKQQQELVDARIAATGTGTKGQAATERGAVGSYLAHEQYRALIEQAANAAGIDPDAFAALLQNETPDGDARAVGGDGEYGLGQILPATWQGLVKQGIVKADADPFDPATNLNAAAQYYASLVRQYHDYYVAAAAYNGGPGAIFDNRPRDYVRKYADNWQKNYTTIKATRRTTTTGDGQGGGWGLIFAGRDYPISQEYGHTDYAAGHPYIYGSEYGLTPDQHPGLDVGTPDGTPLYSPVGGLIVVAGNQYFNPANGQTFTGGAYYTDERGLPAASSGEVRIQLDNGDLLILGHNAALKVKAGQRVNPGDLLALSGVANGPHVHVEVRVRDAALRSGYRIVDPRSYLARLAQQQRGVGPTQ